MSNKKIHYHIHLAIRQYHHYNFQLKHEDYFHRLTTEKAAHMQAYVNMWDDLVETIRKVEGIDYIETYIYDHEHFEEFCSQSNYYYRRNKVDNILWKYLFDC